MPVSWKVQVLGAAVWGHIALGCPDFLLKLCLSFSLPAIRMGSGCGAVSALQLDTPSPSVSALLLGVSLLY